MRQMFKMAVFLLLAVLAVPVFGQAQVVQWNQVVADKALENAFHRALREVSMDYITKMDEAGTPAVITFVDSQLDYPLQLTTGNFRHIQLNAAQNKLGYLLRYQAKTTRGVQVPLAEAGFSSQGAVTMLPSQRVGVPFYGGAEIPGDGAMMLCPVSRSGLEFMYGGLSVASLDDTGAFRSEEDGAAIEQLHDRILDLTYRYYGHSPQ